MNRINQVDKYPLILSNECSTAFDVMCNIFFRLAANLTRKQRSLRFIVCLLAQIFCKVPVPFPNCDCEQNSTKFEALERAEQYHGTHFTDEETDTSW